MKTELLHLTTYRLDLTPLHLFQKNKLTQCVTETGVSARPGVTNDNCAANHRLLKYPDG